MSNNTFSTRFVAAVREVLSIGCADGERMTREQVCEKLEAEGYSVSPAVLGLAIADGVINNAKQGWYLAPGRFGGIRELDLEATAKAEAEFQAKAEKVRARIAKAMETKAAKKAAKVSAVQATA